MVTAAVVLAVVAIKPISYFIMGNLFETNVCRCKQLCTLTLNLRVLPNCLISQKKNLIPCSQCKLVNSAHFYVIVSNAAAVAEYFHVLMLL